MSKKKEEIIEDKFDTNPQYQKLREEYLYSINKRRISVHERQEDELTELEKSKYVKKAKRIRNAFIAYSVLIIIVLVVVYPFLWMVGSTFKDSSRVFADIGIFTKKPTITAYKTVLNKYGGNINIIKALINTYTYVIPEVILTVISSLITAYGFARFEFIGKKVFYVLMMSTLFFPQVVLYIPQYILFSKWHMVGSEWYLPLIIPTAFATESYFVYMFIQFLNNTSKEYEDNARIDGCNYLGTFLFVVIPMMMPVIITSAVFKFTWASNDLLGPVLYVVTPAKYPASLFVKMSMDSAAGFNWARILAIAFISIIPNVIVFVLASNIVVEEAGSEGTRG